ncbi:MAG: CesT family type III secretion system chaperone [Chlamydiales bacterium]
MQPYEDLIQQLGAAIGVTLKADTRQSCLIEFPGDNVKLQVDLDSSGERVLVGTQLGELISGVRRESILMQGLKVNSLPRSRCGILAYSEKNNTLVLFQYLPLASIDGTKLHSFLQLFVEHARLWKESLKEGRVPPIEGEETIKTRSGMLGL